MKGGENIITSTSSVVSLGLYPGFWDLGPERTRVIMTDAFDANIDISRRDPFVHQDIWYRPGAQSYQWHQDCHGSRQWLLLWADLRPTEIRLADGTILRPEPFELVAIRNADVQHRAPALSHVEKRTRHFVVIRVGFNPSNTPGFNPSNTFGYDSRREYTVQDFNALRRALDDIFQPTERG